MTHASRLPARWSLFAVLLAAAAGTVAVLLLAAPARAVPARPGLTTLTQPGGARFAARLFGDEWYNGHESRDGHTIVQDARGRWLYAVKAADGSLRASALVVGRDHPTMRPHLRDARLAARGRRARTRGEAAAPGAAGGDQLPQAVTSLGSDRSLVILAQFADQASVGTTPGQWSTAFFGAGKSVAGYYRDASGGQFTLAPAAESSGTSNDGIVGWVTLPMNHPNQSTIDVDNQLVSKAAIEAADPFVDYASYDTNGDGVVSNTELHVTVIAAGAEASYGLQTAKWVWGHRWTIWQVPVPVVDGKQVGGLGYTQFGEMHGDHMAAMGIMVHEMGHDLGLPDLYDTDQTSEGVGGWSVMGSGSWGWADSDAYQGMTPPLFDAWSRWFKGWITPQVVTGTTTASIDAATSGTSNVAVQLRDNPGGAQDWGSGAGAGEYFLVENRQTTPGTYDASLPGSGLLVWHVDESRPNNATDAARLLDVEEADGLRQLDLKLNRGDAGDLYRGGGATSFTAGTNPDSRLNDGTASGVSMTGVSASGPTMSATFASSGGGGSTAPAHDAFAAAEVATARVYDATADTSAATVEVGETTQAGCSIGRTVWYRYTPTRDVRVTATTAGSGFDTVLNAWQGTSLGALTGLGCSDDAGGGTTSALPELVARAGQTYYFQAGGYYDTVTGSVASGTLAFHLRVRPVNDDFAQATTITGVSGTATGNNENASKEPGEPAHAGNAGGGSVWWRWTAPASGSVTLDTLGSAASVDTLLGVYTGSTPGALTEVAANDDVDPTDRRSRLTFPATAGTTYSIAVDSYGGATPGELALGWSQAVPTAPDAPTGVSATAGDASATVSWTPGAANGSPITGYTVTTSPGGATTSAPAGATSTTVTGLTNGRAYTFTVRATNAVGTGPASAASPAVTPVAAPAPTDAAVSLALVDRPATTGFAYRATVTRTHLEDLADVSVSIALPSTVRLATVPAGCTGLGTLVCDLGPVPTGTSTYVDLGVVPLSPGPHAATARLQTPDATPGNDSATAVASVDFVCDNAPTGANDRVTGTAGADVLCGLAGNDTLAGGGGDDLVFGGAGQDTLSYAAARGAMLVNLDAQSLASPTAWEAVAGTGDGQDYANGIERVQGSRFADVLNGRAAGNDLLWGLGGNDTVYGYGGNDSLYGGDGVDLLYGGDGKDHLYGQAGRDRLDGGGQRDTCRERSDIRVGCEA